MNTQHIHNPLEPMSRNNISTLTSIGRHNTINSSCTRNTLPSIGRCSTLLHTCHKSASTHNRLFAVILMVMMLGWGSHARAFEGFAIQLANTNPVVLPSGVTEVSNNGNNGTHGWISYVFKFTADCPVKITLQKCYYGNNAYVQIGSNKYPLNTKQTEQNCNGEVFGIYNKESENVEIEVHCGDYCHYVKVEKIVKDYSSDAVYDAIVDNVTKLKQALSNADGTSAKRFRIFVKNGTYDLGTDYDTKVPDYTTIIGESRDGVVIENFPAKEGIWTSSTLRTGSNVIIQNITLHSNVTYDSTEKAERGTSLYDDGSNNVYRNICLLGRQDTYYSADATNSYFENCEIHGTVDFICGSGNAWFEKCTLLLESHDYAYITAARQNSTPAANYKGYTFNNCTVDNAAGADMSGKYYLGRAWDGHAKVSYYNTTYNITPNASKWTAMSGGNHDVSIDESAASTAASSTMGAEVVSTATPLAAPAEVNKEGTSFTWAAVTGADAYMVFKNDVYEQSVETTSATVDADGTYSVAALSAAGIIGKAASTGRLNTSAEESNQNTPDGWNPVQLPSVTYHSDVTLPTEGTGALSATANNRAIIQAAIDAANTAGGGIVRIPAGTWLSGPLVMKSNVVLHLNAGATLMAMPFGGVDYADTSLDGENYPWSGKNNSSEKKNYQMFISCASGSENVAVEGEGDTSIIDGQGAAWWPNRDALGTRPPLIRFEQGSKFLVRNIKLQNAPGTNLTLGNSGKASQFTVHDVTIKNPSSVQSEATADGYSAVSHNTDGIPVWGPFVNIYNCTIDTGDDNVVFDSYSHHGHVWNCTFKRGHGASFGSYTVGVHDIIYEDITFQGTSQGFRIKTNRKERSGNDQAGTSTNGAVKNIICRNSTMTGVTEPITLTTHYESEVQDPSNVASAAVTVTTPEYHDILFQNITATNPGSAYSGWNHQNPIMIYGLPELYIHDITFDNVKIAANSSKGAYLAYCDKISFINGTTITGTSTPVTTKYNVTNTIGGLKASDLTLASGKESQTLSVGDTHTIAKGADYTTSSDGAMSFASSNDAVATVSAEGVITAIGAGTATITVSQESNVEWADKSVEISVKVSAAAGPKTIYSWESAGSNKADITETGGTIEYVNGKDASTDYRNYAQGSYYTILINGKKANLSDPTGSDNAGHMVITLDEGLKEGDKITMTGFRNKKDTGKKSSIYMLFEKGTKFEGTEGGMYWTNIASDSTNPDYDDDGDTPNSYTWTVPAAEEGSKTITLTRNDGGTNLFITKIQITGLRDDKPASDLAAVTGTKTMGVGDTYTLAATTDYTTSSTGAVSFESSDDTVATVDAEGKITAVATGTATITINQAADATYAAGTCEITLKVIKTEEKVLYSTDFQNWDNVSASTSETPVPKKTTDEQDLTFTLFNTAVDKEGTNTKFTGAMCTKGYLQTAKDATNVPYIITSALNNITKFELVQAATGTGRGVTVYVKGDGDADWVELHNKGIVTSGGETLTFNNVNRTNCQIKIGTFAPNQNAYVLSLKIYGNVEVQGRTFTDFKIDFQQNPRVVTLPVDGNLPTGVTIEGTSYNGAQHGVQNGTITVPVDGPVKFTIGSCHYGNHTVTVKDSGGNTIATLDNDNGCDSANEKTKFITWTYNVEEANTLSFTLDGYMPFFYAEACDFVPTVDVTYYNTDGKTVIGKKTVDGGSALEIAYGVSDVTVADGYVFRGWYDKAKDGKKVANGKVLNENLNIYAVATKREEATEGSKYSYDLTKDYFYQEDHECITMTNGKFHDGTHGWEFGANGTIQIPVSGSANIKLTLCQYGSSGKITVKNANDESVAEDITLPVGSDGATSSIEYRGPATTLTFTLTNGGYVHKVDVENLNPLPTDLAIPEGKGEIVLFKNGTKVLKKGEDYTTLSSAVIKFKSSNTDVVTVSDDGKLTATEKYGYSYVTLTHQATATERETTVTFLVKVVAEDGQTVMPSATVGDDGTVTIVKSKKSAEGTKIYYTTDGSAPDENSTEYTAPVQVTAGTTVQAIAIDGDGKKSMSDVRQIYYKVSATIKWLWDNGFDAKPEVTGDAKAALNSNTRAVIGNKLTPNRQNDVGGFDFVTVQPKEKASNPDDHHTLRFNVVPLAGISFQPTGAGFSAFRNGTDGGKIDARMVSETQDFPLLAGKTPARDNASTPYTKYPNSTDAFTTSFASMPMLEEEWALKVYVYSLDTSKKYGFREITISGLFSGCEFDGNFYDVTASTNPAEGGTAEHIPSASRIMEDKEVTFKATSAMGYEFTGWTKLDDTNIIGTEKTYVVNALTENTNLEAHFVKLPIISFSKNNDAVTGSVPTEQYVEEGTHELFIPYNHTLYREGWYLDYWTNGSEKYYPGNTYVFNENMTLTPVFTSSDSKKITDTDAVTTVKWNFDNKLDPHAAPKITVAADNTTGAPKTTFYTMRSEVGGTPVELKMNIDAETGSAKFDNDDARVVAIAGYGSQINNDTKVTIPAVSGMKVTIKASGKQDTQFNRQTNFGDGSEVDIVFGESDKGTAVDNKTLTYTYTGDASQLQILFNVAGTYIDAAGDKSKTWGFYEYIEVEYPVLPDVLLQNVITTTPLLSDQEQASNAGVVEKSATTHTNTGSRYMQGDVVTITAKANYGYYISAVKSGDTVLPITKQQPSADAPQPTKVTATYTVGESTGTVTVEYERLPMVKVRVESADAKLGDVDFTDGNKYDNFYTKGDGWVESWFAEGSEVTAMSIAADDYVTEKWSSESTPELSTQNQYIFTVPSSPETLTFFAHFKHGEVGNVIFDIEHPVIIDGNTIKPLPDDFGDPYDARSLAPSKVENLYSFTIPKYHTVFKTGYTLRFWKKAGDTDDSYAIGNNYSFQTANETITLVPVYEQNPSDQMNRINEPIMLYEFGTGKGIRAQKVKLEKNTDTYWTAQVRVITITDGVEHPHDRDVAVHVSTGSKGFIRNGDLPEWASFGPGTKFTIASCAGTRVEIMSYAEMSTTTFDGKPFTLVSKDEAKHEYIYECTTESPEARVPIIIGDDYSYYKYIKVYSKKANRVNLHADVDDKARGRVTVVDAINKDIPDPIVELEDGGHSFNQGNSVKVVFKRRFGFEFEKIVDTDRELSILEMLPDNKVKMITSSTDATFETISSNADGTWGGDGHLFYLKKTEPATDEDMVDSLRTTYELHFNITTHRNIQICYKEKPTYYVTYNAGKQATGVPPAAAWIEGGDKYVIPENRSLYFEGNTLKYWVDAQYDSSKPKDDAANTGHVYEIGSEYTNSGSDILLYPIFEKNTFGLLDISEGNEYKVTWPFAKNLGAPTINYEKSAGLLVSQLKKSATEWIDLKVELDASEHEDANGNKVNGKFNNTSYDDRCQINNNSILTFPTTANCDVELHAVREIAATDIAGHTDYEKGKDVKVTYTGDEASQKVLFESGSYPTHFEVTYKHQNITKPTLTEVKYGDTKLTAEQLAALIANKAVEVTVAPDLAGDAIPEVTVTVSNGEATITQADIDSRKAVIILKTAGGVLAETYNVNFGFSMPETAPEFVRYIINGTEYGEGVREISVDNAPVSGTITLRFNHTMAETSIVSPVYGTTYSAEQGKDLVFNYWNLHVGTESTLSFPASVFKDVYGKALEGSALTVRIKVASTAIPVTHKTFDYIVGRDGDINNAVAKANAAAGSDRYYVFIPDGEYELNGNQKITSQITSDGKAPADSTGVNRTDLLGREVDNHMTMISRANVSLIGQSTEGVTLYNRPLIEGIGYTATIHIDKKAYDFYAEDLQLVNRFPYWKSLNAQGSSGAGRAVAFWDQGNRSIMKNVEMWSYQDTYYSSNANDDYRGYFENCTIAGVVDFLCGDGNIWLEKCDIVLRDRAGNNIAAPSQENTQKWGYVFNNCNIKPEVSNPKELKDKNWSLARPWANATDKSPAATYLNTKMWLMPRDAGWEKMGTGAILRFHEYHTMDKGGNQVSLGSRSLAACAPGAGSDDCILSAADAAKYTIESVMGGTDLFMPRVFTQQIDAKSGNEKDADNSLAWDDQIEIDDDRLQWNTEPMALCYFIFRKDEQNGKWIYVTNVKQSTEDETVTGISLADFEEGIYCVRAANQRGGLGAPTKEIEYKESEKYTLTIKQVGSDTDGFVSTHEGYGWSTICLPYNSKVPTVNKDGNPADLKVYAGTTIDGYDLKLTPVDVINKGKGYVVYGPVGDYEFASSSHTTDVETILEGNPTAEPILKGNNNGYVLSYKSTYGVGFYKYTGTTLAANRAWLPIDAVSEAVQKQVSSGAKAIVFKVASLDISLDMDTIFTAAPDDIYIYDLNGRRIDASQMVKGNIYIINGKKVTGK